MIRALGAVACALFVSAILLGGQAPAWSKPTPTPVKTTAAAPQAQNGAGQEVCAITGSAAARLSGLVARPDGFVAVNDAELNQSNEKIFFFDSNCKPKATTVSYPTNAIDPEDLAIGTDNVLWVADIGDNSKAVGGTGTRRETIALWSLAPGVNAKPTLHRLHYPDGPHDAEALVLNGDNTPVIVTKEDEDLSAPKDTAGVYVASGPLQPNATVELTKAGDFKIPATETSSPLGPIGRKLVTGGANSPDRKKVALRTYTDAFEWDVTDGSAATAIVKGTPRITPLPGEKQGESLAYSTDGKSFLTISDQQAGPTPILQYTPSTATPSSAASAAPAAPGPKKSWKDWITPSRLRYVVGGVGVFGLLLMVIGVVGIRRSRAARRDAAIGAKVHAAAPPGGQPGEGTGAVLVVGDDSAWQPDWSDPEWSGVSQGNPMIGHANGAPMPGGPMPGGPMSGGPMAGGPMAGGPAGGGAVYGGGPDQATGAPGPRQHGTVYGAGGPGDGGYGPPPGYPNPGRAPMRQPAPNQPTQQPSGQQPSGQQPHQGQGGQVYQNGAGRPAPGGQRGDYPEEGFPPEVADRGFFTPSESRLPPGAGGQPPGYHDGNGRMR